MRTRRFGALAAIAVFTSVLAGCGEVEEAALSASNAVASDADPAAAGELGDESTPALSAPQTAGVTLATVEDVVAFLEANRDKVLVINFWATWCPPCVHEMPELAAFYEAYRDRGVAFLSLSSDSLEDYETKLVPFVKERDLPFHVYAIASADPDELDKYLKVGMNFALPTTFVFDQERNLVQKWMRNITQADLEAVVEPLVSDKP